MQTKTSSKLALLCALALGAGVSTAVLATAGTAPLSSPSTAVKSDLTHSVQTIQEVVFTQDGLRPTDSTAPVVRMKIDGKSLIFEGKVLVTNNDADNKLGPTTTASTLFAGERNTVAGDNSAVMAGQRGVIEPDTTGVAIL